MKTFHCDICSTEVQTQNELQTLRHSIIHESSGHVIQEVCKDCDAELNKIKTELLNEHMKKEDIAIREKIEEMLAKVPK